MSKRKKTFQAKAQDSQERGITPKQSPKDTARSVPKTIHITDKVAIALIVALGLITYATGLNGAFLGDDQLQIVANATIHTLNHLGLLFRGGTGYSGSVTSPLAGVYYRPIMMVAYAFLYTAFGPTPFAFHFLQLMLQIVSAIILYRVFKYFFRPWVALVLALIFLVHPINSQSVYYISNLQEPLYFFFGIVAFWTLVKFQDKSRRYLLATGVALMLSMLSKETGLLFLFICLAYTALADRVRLKLFSIISAFCLIVYLALKVPAVGLSHSSTIAPIDSLSLVARLLNVPAIIFFYFYKFIFPLQLSRDYDWVVRSVTLTGFVLPLLADLVVFVCGFYIVRKLKNSGRTRDYTLFIFFAMWLLAGLSLSLQIIPLDQTVSETWFYFAIVGLLGMIGVLIEAYPIRLTGRVSFTLAATIILMLSFRTSLRGFDWKSELTLASSEPESFTSESMMAHALYVNGDLTDAKIHAEKSVTLYPNEPAYFYLGEIDEADEDYPEAQKAFTHALNLEPYYYIYDGLALEDVSDPAISPNEGISFINAAITKYPKDYILWTCLAEEEYDVGLKTEAKQAIAVAQSYGYVAPSTYQTIMSQ